MPLSREVRRLEAKWKTGSGWPKRLDWIEIKGLRGWTGQRFDLHFPIMAVVGENGAGKSSVLQAAASVYARQTDEEKERFASDFFPDTTWDHVRDAEIGYAVRENGAPHISSVRKPTGRWRRNPDRRRRHVEYIDLSRIQPVPARIGYSRLANPALTETHADAFEKTRLNRFSAILGRTYELAKMAFTSGDANRSVPVITQHGSTYSGFHQGAGETTIAELLGVDIPKYSLVLIDEVESSLHPRAQRRLIRDLAELCRESELQIVLTTHSPYVLEELPLDARACIIQALDGSREIVYGVSPEFAMTQMDDIAHHECDLYVEDQRARGMLIEILAAHSPALVKRCQIITYGAASVGMALGQMAANDRFPRPTLVFLDGDNGPATGCLLLPGDDAPERVVFESLQACDWGQLALRTGRGYSDVVDACRKAMALTSHHDWVGSAADSLVLGGEALWQMMCAEWASGCMSAEDAHAITQPILDLLAGIEPPTVAAQTLNGVTPTTSVPTSVAKLPKVGGTAGVPQELFSA